MSSTLEFQITSPKPVYGRFATFISQEVNKLPFGEAVYFQKDCRRAKVTSILGLLSLGINANEPFEVCISDGYEEQADLLRKIIALEE